MKKLKFTEDGFRRFNDFDGSYKQTIEAFTHDELFEPLEPEPIVLDGVDCAYKELEDGDWFVWVADDKNCLKLKTDETGYVFLDGGYQKHDGYLKKDKVINFGKRDTISENFKVKIKENDIKPCWFCGGKKCEVICFPGMCYKVICTCGYSSKGADPKEIAIEHHNNPKFMEGK